MSRTNESCHIRMRHVRKNMKKALIINRTDDVTDQHCDVCDAMCCSAMQFVVVRCCVLQCVASRDVQKETRGCPSYAMKRQATYDTYKWTNVRKNARKCVEVRCSVLQCVPSRDVQKDARGCPLSAMTHHATYEWVVSYTNESCRIRLSHVTRGWVMPHWNESWNIWRSHVTCEWVMSYMNESSDIQMSWANVRKNAKKYFEARCSVLQCVAVCSSVLYATYDKCANVRKNAREPLVSASTHRGYTHPFIHAHSSNTITYIYIYIYIYTYIYTTVHVYIYIYK